MQSRMSLTRRGIAREAVVGWCFLVPSLIGFLFYYLIPILSGATISFTDFGGITRPFQFVGWSNFQRLIQDKYVLTSLKNNLLYALTFTPATLALSLLLATALHGAGRCRKFYRVCFFLPYISSMVAVAVIWRLLMNPSSGPINALLMALGVASPPKWLMSVDWALYSVVIISVWKQFGYYMIILLAGLQIIPSHLYESAVIDGASPFQCYRRITLPMLTPTLFLCVIMLIISSFQVFDLVNVLTNGGPGMATNVLVYRIYMEAFKYGKLGYAASISVFLFMIVLVVTLVQFLGQRFWVNYD